MTNLILQNSKNALLEGLDEKCSYLVEFLNVNSRELLVNGKNLILNSVGEAVTISGVNQIKIEDAEGNNLNGIINFYRIH